MLLNKEKESWVKFNPGLSANSPSNNWARVYERVGKFNYAISIYKKDQKGLQMHSKVVKRSRKSSGFEIYSHF